MENLGLFQGKEPPGVGGFLQRKHERCCTEAKGPTTPPGGCLALGQGIRQWNFSGKRADGRQHGLGWFPGKTQACQEPGLGHRQHLPAQQWALLTHSPQQHCLHPPDTELYQPMFAVAAYTCIQAASRHAFASLVAAEMDTGELVKFSPWLCPQGLSSALCKATSQH